MDSPENITALLAEPLPPMLALALRRVYADPDAAPRIAALACGWPLADNTARVREFEAWLRARRPDGAEGAELWIHCLYYASRAEGPAARFRDVTATAVRLHDWFAAGKLPRHFLSP